MEKLLLVSYREHPEVQKWKKQMRVDHLERGSVQKIFQYCLDSSGQLLHMRAMQNTSGGNCEKGLLGESAKQRSGGWCPSCREQQGGGSRSALCWCREMWVKQRTEHGMRDV